MYSTCVLIWVFREAALGHSAAMGISSDEDDDTPLLWGHHRASKEQRRRDAQWRKTERRKCLRGSACFGLAAGVGVGLVTLFPGSVSNEAGWYSSSLIASARGRTPVRGWRAQPSSLLAGIKGSSQHGHSHRHAPSHVHSLGSALSPRHDGLIEKSEHDTRHYRAVSLANGMKVLLVSDPTSTSSAAAVDVAVGTWNDPEQLPGLAHFCEHMMFFLDRALYPRDDEFQAYLSEHGGGTNAFTADTHTNYYFSVRDDALPGALQRYSAFFTAPTFDATMVSREFNAVNSEHMKNLQSDEWRNDQLSRSIASAVHPYHKFGTGSLATLDGRPGLRESLVQWHASRYSAARSTLVIVSPQSLDTLQGYAEHYFSNVSSPSLATEPWKAAVEAGARPYPPSSLPRGYLVQPVSQVEALSITWQLPGQRSVRRAPCRPGPNADPRHAPRFR